MSAWSRPENLRLIVQAARVLAADTDLVAHPASAVGAYWFILKRGSPSHFSTLDASAAAHDTIAIEACITTRAMPRSSRWADHAIFSASAHC